MQRRSVLIADDHLLLRETLALFLTDSSDLSVDSAGTLPEALDKVSERGGYDVVLLDLVMPGMNGVSGVSEMVQANPKGAVMLMSGSATSRQVDQAIRLGARGFLPKSLSPNLAQAALRSVLQGRIFLPDNARGELASGPLPDSLAHLSNQEGRVLRLLCRGMSNKEIAREMRLAEITIKSHMRSICGKLDARNRTHAALIGNALLVD